MAWVHSSFPSERTRSIGVTELIQLRFHAFTRHPTKHTDELLLLPTFQQTCPYKTNFSGSRIQRYSLRLVFLLTFVSRRSLALRSAPPVNPACAALRGAYPKSAPCSLPRPLAPLRSGD